MLEDAAHVQDADARHIARLIARGVDLRPVTPLYGPDDVVAALAQMDAIPYRRRHAIAPGVDVTFLDAGHVLGSAIVVLDVLDGGARTRIAFTGDLGRRNLPILRDPEVPTDVDVLITESTYGDRGHTSIDESAADLVHAIGRAAARGGKVIVPSFALERAQEVIYTLAEARRAGRMTLPVFVDSPLATRLTDVFRLHPDCYDRETYEALQGGRSPFDFDGLRYVTDVEDSKRLDADPGSLVIIAGSGMCEGGRVLHHLRAAVADPRHLIAIVGFQAEHTLGRRIAERRPQVRIFGVMHELHAEVVVLDGFSAHADQAGLVDYAQRVAARGALRAIVLVHGERAAQEVLAARLGERVGAPVVVPAVGDRVALTGSLRSSPAG
jgi:metallo-beta-lactamase family protein